MCVCVCVREREREMLAIDRLRARVLVELSLVRSKINFSSSSGSLYSDLHGLLAGYELSHIDRNTGIVKSALAASLSRDHGCRDLVRM